MGVDIAKADCEGKLIPFPADRYAVEVAIIVAIHKWQIDIFYI